MDGRDIFFVVTQPKPNQWIEEQRPKLDPKKIETVMVRDFFADKMIITLKIHDVVSKNIFKRKKWRNKIVSFRLGIVFPTTDTVIVNFKMSNIFFCDFKPNAFEPSTLKNMKNKAHGYFSVNCKNEIWNRAFRIWLKIERAISKIVKNVVFGLKGFWRLKNRRLRNYFKAGMPTRIWITSAL